MSQGWWWILLEPIISETQICRSLWTEVRMCLVWISDLVCASFPCRISIRRLREKRCTSGERLCVCVNMEKLKKRQKKSNQWEFQMQVKSCLWKEGKIKTATIQKIFWKKTAFVWQGQINRAKGTEKLFIMYIKKSISETVSAAL